MTDTYCVLSGDFDIKVQISALQNAGSTSTAGLMLRQSGNSADIFALVGITGNNQFVFKDRTTSGANAVQQVGGSTSGANTWVRLVRAGTTIRAYAATDSAGTQWSQIGSDLTLAMTDPVMMGMAVASGSSIVTTTASFRNVNLPLSSTTVSYDLMLGSFAIYTAKIFDPRQTGISEITIAGQSVALTRQSSYFQSEEFVCTAPGQRLDVQGLPSKVIRISGDPVSIHYNPTWPFSSGPEITPPPSGQKVIANLIEQITESMKTAGWTSPNPRYPGAFGKEVHARVSAVMQNKSGWLIDAYIDNDTKEILSVGTSPGGSNYAQVDALELESGYAPKQGSILEPSRCTQVYDIKTSVDGRMSEFQADKLRPFSKSGTVVSMIPKNTLWAND